MEYDARILDKATRVEIYRNGENIARDWDANGVEVHVQDLGHTLKIFYRTTGEDVVWPYGANGGANSEEELAENIAKTGQKE